MATINFSDWAKGNKEVIKDFANFPKLYNGLKELAEKFEFETSLNSETFKIRKAFDFKPEEEDISESKLREAVLEKSFLSSDKVDFYNQFSFKGANRIDMLQLNEAGEISEIFELKRGDSKEYVFKAIYEILFYQLLLIHIKNKDKIPLKAETVKVADDLKLYVVAPKEFFTQKEGVFNETEVNRILKDKGAPEIGFIKIDLPEDEWNKFKEAADTFKEMQNKLVGAFLSAKK